MYYRIKGIRQGSAGSSDKQFACGITQQDIAKELGVSMDTIRRFKKLNTLSPELQELISDGTVKYTTALNVWGKLSNEEQVKLINEVGKETIANMKAKETQQYINENRELKVMAKINIIIGSIS